MWLGIYIFIGCLVATMLLTIVGVVDDPNVAPEGAFLGFICIVGWPVVVVLLLTFGCCYLVHKATKNIMKLRKK